MRALRVLIGEVPHLASEKSSLKNMGGTTHSASARPSPGVKGLLASASCCDTRLLRAASDLATREAQAWR